MLRAGKSFSGRERNCVYLNTGGPRFANISATSGLDFADDARSAAAIDWDFDGDLDLWIRNRTTPRVRYMRNDQRTDHHFLAIRLAGATCNRDAVGARVELHIGDRIQIATVRAGNSFLTQSVKWLHFGLGDKTRIDRAVIRWPGGEAQALDDLPIDQYVTVTQGEAPKRWSPPRSDSALTPGPLAATPPTDKARIILPATVPLLPLAYNDLTGKSQTHRAGKATLINLWASWCAPCVEELTQFNQQAEALKLSRLAVIALSVDGLDGTHTTSAADARELVQQLGLTFPTGMADAALLDRFNLVHNTLLELDRPLPVPTSLLLDANGRLSMIYRGPVQVKQLLADIELLASDEPDRRKLAARFPGRWYSRQRSRLPMELVDRCIEGGQLDDAGRYLRVAEQQGQTGGAALINLGNALITTGRSDEGIAYLRRAVQQGSDDVIALTNLGVALTMIGRPADALPHLRAAVERAPDNGHVHDSLADALIAANQPVQAARHYDQALQLEPASMGTALKLAQILATRDDPDLPRINVVNLAEQLAKATRHREPVVLEVLAAAYAKAGRFADAVAMAERAGTLAREAERDDLAGHVDAALLRYRNGQR